MSLKSHFPTQTTLSPYSLANNATALPDLVSRSLEYCRPSDDFSRASCYDVNHPGENLSFTSHPSYQSEVSQLPDATIRADPYDQHHYYHMAWSQDANPNEHLGASPIGGPTLYGLENLNLHSPYLRTYSQPVPQTADVSSCSACGRPFGASFDVAPSIPRQVWPSPDAGQTWGIDQHSHSSPVSSNFAPSVPFNFEPPNRTFQTLPFGHWDFSSLTAEAPSYQAMNNPTENFQTTDHNLSFRTTPGKRIPQRTYIPTGSGKIFGVNNGSELKPIQFIMEDGSEFSLRDALNVNHTGLAGRDEAPVLGSEHGSPISIRIEWPGYKSWNRQMKTRDWRKCPRPISRAKLATEIAKSFKAFVEENEHRQIAADFAEWRVGSADDSPFINVDKLALVALHRVSKGSWQPEFRLLSL